jgi:hypothetical protein
MSGPAEQPRPLRSALHLALELTRRDAIMEPYPLLSRMRREGLVHFSRTLGACLVSRYVHVVRGLCDSRGAPIARVVFPAGCCRKSRGLYPKCVEGGGLAS